MLDFETGPNWERYSIADACGLHARRLHDAAGVIPGPCRSRRRRLGPPACEPLGNVTTPGTAGTLERCRSVASRRLSWKRAAVINRRTGDGRGLMIPYPPTLQRHGRPDFQQQVFVWPADGASNARIHWSVVARDALVLGLRHERVRKIFSRLAPRAQAAIRQPLELLATDEAQTYCTSTSADRYECLLNVPANILELHSPHGTRTSRVHHRQEESMKSKGKYL
jgi:hypothetical protein